MSASARPGSAFRSTLIVVEIHSSATRHGVADEDMVHAIEYAVATEDAGDDPDRWLAVGPDRAGNFLEVVVLVLERREMIIHAMPMRAKYRRLLEQ
jgi:hypothetical protein